MNREESIVWCEQGIAEKRNGNYDKALEFYSKARLADSSNQDIYYNAAKVLIGLGNTEDGIKNLLIYLHLSIFNNIKIDPFTGNRLFNNLLSPDYDDPIKQQLFMKNLELFNYINQYGKPIITDTLVMQGDLVRFLCLARAPLQLCVFDHNLSFYAGICFVLEDNIIQIFNDVKEEELDDLKSGILGKSYNGVLKNTYKEKLFYVLGFLYLAINLKRIKNTLEIPEYYLNKELQIKKDIQNFKVYLENPNSI
jgi:tetratricopeptide (TPR) repeat protein